MKPEPAPGFNAAYEAPVRDIRFRCEIDSHNYLAAETQTGSVVATSTSFYATRIVIPATTAISKVSVMCARDSGMAIDCAITVYPDNGSNAPNLGAPIVTANLVGIYNKEPRFYSASLIAYKRADTGLVADSGLFADSGADSKWIATGGTVYWVRVEPSSGIGLRLFYGPLTGGKIIESGAGTVISDSSLIIKTQSVTAADNVVQLGDLSGFEVTLSGKVDVDKATIRLRNQKPSSSNFRKYSQLQPWRYLLTPSLRVRVYLGNEIGYVRVCTMLIDGVDIDTQDVHIRLLGLNAKATGKRSFKASAFVGQTLTNVYKQILKQGAIDYVDANIEATAQTFPSFGTLSETTVNALNAIAEAVNFDSYFDSDGQPHFKAKRTTFSADYVLSYDKHIVDREISTEKNKDEIFNRILISNGITSNGEPITFAASTVIASYSGELTVAQSYREITVSFATPLYNVEIVDNIGNGATVIQELYRTSTLISFRIYNTEYPNNNVVYNYDVYGATITNVGSLVVAQKLRPFSGNMFGVYDIEITNSLFYDVAQVNRVADDVLLFNGYPRDRIVLNTRGVPVLEVGDVVRVVHPDLIDSGTDISVSNPGLNVQRIYKIKEINMTAVAFPRKLTATYTLESFPFNNGTSLIQFFKYADTGLVADSGLFADAEYTFELLTS